MGNSIIASGQAGHEFRNRAHQRDHNFIKTSRLAWNFTPNQNSLKS